MAWMPKTDRHKKKDAPSLLLSEEKRREKQKLSPFQLQITMTDRDLPLRRALVGHNSTAVRSLTNVVFHSRRKNL